MDKRKNQKIIILLVSSCFSLTYLLWQFIGLRFTNHDDIFLHLASWFFAGDYYGFASYAAFAQSRIQAFINMPIILWVNHNEHSSFYDFCGLTVFAILIFSFAWVIANLTTLTTAITLSISAALLFPLHYYFTFPQSYPVMGAWPLAFLFLSLGFYISYVRSPINYKLALSIILFISSLFGAEYNFVLHPILLAITVVAMLDQESEIKFRNFFELTKPYIWGWLICFILYWSFSYIARTKGLDTVGRMSLNFSFMAWVETFFILQIKSILPLALINGIQFVDLGMQGGPKVPVILTYASMLKGVNDILSILILFVVFGSMFAGMLYIQRITFKFFIILSAVLCSLLFIPCFVVAASTHYQEIVLRGYLQGHLVTFYSQLGYSGLAFVLSCYVIKLAPKPYVKKIEILLFSVTFSAYAVLTFVYNNINRQMMMANKQKWDAIHELSEYVYNSRPDLKNENFYSPNFWLSTGVSSIPDKSPFSGMNYWSEYSEKVLKKPLKITNVDTQTALNKVSVDYVLIPAGNPIVIINETVEETNSQRVTLITSRPVVGKLKYGNDSVSIQDISTKDWECEKQCRYSVKSPGRKITFSPSNLGSDNLLLQYLINRREGFAQPLVRNFD